MIETLEPPQAPRNSTLLSRVQAGASSGDDFQSPPEALEMILPYLRRLRERYRGRFIVWEPCCGEGNLVRRLEAEGFEVIATDIKTGRDFLKWEPDDWQAAVTNIPFSIKDQALSRLFSFGKPFGTLAPLTVLEGKARHRIFRRHRIEVVVPDVRVRYKTPNGQEGKDSAPWFPSCWLTSRMEIREAEPDGGCTLKLWTPPTAQAALALEDAA